MNRRNVLRALAATGAAGLAGCTGSAPGGEGSPTDSPTASPTATPTDSPTPTATESPTATDSPTPVPPSVDVTGRSFEVRNRECGTGNSTATVSHESADGGGVVTVRGVIDGSDTCHSARLAKVVYSEADADLRIRVESYVPEENEGKACGQCIVDIDYGVTVEYEGDPPFTVAVFHDGERVTESGPYRS